MRNQVQLITYADRLAGDLPGVRELLSSPPVAGVFGGVHVLPFFTPIDGADAGFDPIDHREVDPRLGTWDDVASLAEHVEVMADLVVNHVSSDSPQFQDVRAHGDASPHAGMFLTYDRMFPDGATEADLLRLYRPRPGLPFTPIRRDDGTRHLYWTTFTSQQLDLDVDDPATVAYLRGILELFARAGVRAVRLDAVGYAVKTAGTSCFLTPETWEFIDRLTAWAHELGLEVLVEIHAHFQRQVDIAERVDWVYDFALPPLVLDALFTGDAGPLTRWLRSRPRNAVTVLDTHDGIGVIDVGADSDGTPGLLPPERIDALVERIHEHSGGTSRQATGAAASNVDLYQVNCTFHDALGRDDRAYLLARMLQLFTPGIPQIYYVGLLAGDNDVALLERTGVGRDINRHRYDDAEVRAALVTDVVRRLLALARFRSHHPAFGGTWALLDAPAHVVHMRWEAGPTWAELVVDVDQRSFRLSWRGPDGEDEVDDMQELTRLPGVEDPST